MNKSEREVRDRLRVQRENRDRGWREMLATPIGRQALYELYAECMAERDVVRGMDGKTSVPDTMRALGKQAIGNWLSNRAMLADHRNWLVLLAENERPLDDGRASDTRAAEAEAEAGETQ